MGKKKGPSTGSGLGSAKKGESTEGVSSKNRPLMAANDQPPPTTPSECTEWRDRDVRQRIRQALSNWSQQPLGNILSTTTLGQLAVGTGIPWNEGNQARLVLATNQQNVFHPFPAAMDPPSVLVSSSTTVADWERVVWQRQNPHTDCFVFG